MSLISNTALTSRFRAMKLPMPSVVLRTLFDQNILPTGAFLVSGSDETRINWARLVAPEPASLNSAAEGDFVIVPLGNSAQRKDADRDMAWIISKLTEARARVLCIQGAVSVVALEAAARYQMAVVYLPEDVSAEKIERGIIRFLMERQSLLEQRDQELQQELTRHVNSNYGLPQLMKTLANILKLPIFLHDARRLRLAYGLPDGDTEKNLQWQQHYMMLQDSQLVAHFAENPRPTRIDSSILESQHSLSIALHADNETTGYLTALKNQAEADEFTGIALNRAALVCSLLLNKQRAGEVTDKRSRSDWISAWLESYSAEDHMILARAEQTGYSLEQVYVIVVMRWTPGRNPKRPPKPIRPEQLTEQVKHEVGMRRISAIVGQHADRTILFLPLERAQHTGRMKQYAKSICEKMSEVLGGNVVCGVGRPGLGLTEIRRSFEEAERALTLTEQVWDGTRSSFFGDLSLSKLLLNVHDHQHLQEFCQDWLHDILAYDGQNHSDLLLTMSVYFGNNGNMAATAKQLNVHRNTLVYRLNRIAEITQLDMDDADVQLNLHLAIKAYQLLEALGLQE
jgi:purine catabolism regulator